MQQVVDLGTSTFKSPRLGQCLLSKATATLVLQNDVTDTARKPTGELDLKAIWVNVKRELTVNLCLETSWSFLSSLPITIKQLVDTLEISLTRIGFNLRVSRVSYESYSSADSITVHVSMVLCETFDRPRHRLRGRLPRQVRGCALVDPHPPPEITIGTLSDITIRLKSPLFCNSRETIRPQDLPELLPSDEGNANNSGPSPKRRVISLHPCRESLSNCFYGQDQLRQSAELENAKNRDPESGDRLLDDDDMSRSFEKGWAFGALLDYSIQSLFLQKPKQCTKKIDEVRSNGSFRVSEIAPLILSPGYYDNIRHRAGLVPVVTKSITSMFHKSLSCRSTAKLSFVEPRLKAHYEHAADTGLDKIIGPSIRCAVWTALQRREYMASRATNTSPMRLPITSLTDDNMLMEDCDPEQESDEDVLLSSEHLITDLMGPHVGSRDNDMFTCTSQEKDTLRSFSESELFDDHCDVESSVSEWQASNYDSDFEFRLHGNGTESLCWSSSLELKIRSDMKMENAVSSRTSLCESVIDSDRFNENSIIEGSVSLSELCVSPCTTDRIQSCMSTMSSTTGNIGDILASDVEQHHSDEDIGSIGNNLNI